MSSTRGVAAGVAAASPGRGASPVDIALAVGVGLVQVLGTYLAAQHQPQRRSWDLLAVGLLAAGPLALLVRRRYPVTVLLLSFATVLAYSVIGYGQGPVFFAMIVALVTVVMAGHRMIAIGVLIAGYIGFLWLGPLLDRDKNPTPAATVGLAAWLLVLFGASELLRMRRERAVEATHLREEETRRRMSDERRRIAQELHDIIAHNISLINVQAATTLHLLEGGEQSARNALATIKQVSQETLVELRSVLGVLRRVDETAPRAPAPTLGRVDELVARAREAGVAARVEIEGTPRSLPSAVDLAAYRIIQEALTNVARHAKAKAATVRVTYRDGAVVVEVNDLGSPPRVVVPGNGIAGMTERATALGGTLDAAARAGGGFRVRAWLPVEDVR